MIYSLTFVVFLKHNYLQFNIFNFINKPVLKELQNIPIYFSRNTEFKYNLRND